MARAERDKWVSTWHATRTYSGIVARVFTARSDWLFRTIKKRTYPRRVPLEMHDIYRTVRKDQTLILSLLPLIKPIIFSTQKTWHNSTSWKVMHACCMGGWYVTKSLHVLAAVWHYIIPSNFFKQLFAVIIIVHGILYIFKLTRPSDWKKELISGKNFNLQFQNDKLPY